MIYWLLLLINNIILIVFFVVYCNRNRGRPSVEAERDMKRDVERMKQYEDKDYSVSKKQFRRLTNRNKER